MKAVIDTERKYYKYNVTEAGNLTKNKGVLSGFSASNYVSFSRPTFDYTFEVGAKITTGNSVSGLQIIYSPDTDQEGVRLEVNDGHFGLLCGSNGTWINTSSYTGGTALPNTDYYLKANFNGTDYKLDVSTNGISYNTVVSYNSSSLVTNIFSNYFIGTYLDHNVGIFQGDIDLNDCYIKINNQLVWQGVIESTVSDYDYSVGDNTVKLVKEGNNYYVFNL